MHTYIYTHLVFNVLYKELQQVILSFCSASPPLDKHYTEVTYTQ